jgi:ethanolamine permease
LAIGAYLNVQFSSVDPKLARSALYVVFMALNIVGGAHRRDVRAGHHCDLFELLVFMGVVSPGFSIASPKGGWSGGTASAWRPFPASSPPSVRDLVFLAIEGVAWRPEAKVKRSINRLSAGILTLVLAAIGVMLFAGGAGTGPNWPTSTTRCHKP